MGCLYNPVGFYLFGLILVNVLLKDIEMVFQQRLLLISLIFINLFPVLGNSAPRHTFAVDILFTWQDNRVWIFDGIETEIMVVDGHSSYKNRGSILKLKTVDGEIIQYQFNKTNQIRKIDYKKGETLKFKYKGNGLLKRIKSSDGLLVTFKYDSHKRLSKIKSSDGKSIEIKYNSRGRIRNIKGGIPGFSIY